MSGGAGGSAGVQLVLYAAAALLPGLAWLYYFYRLDKYEPEPAWLLARTFLFGALMLVPVWVLEGILLEGLLGIPPGGLVGLERTRLLAAVMLVVGPVEETLKFLAAYASVGHHPEYDEPMDGVVYTTAAALGFATAENLYYVSVSGVGVLLGRGLFSCFLHASCTGLMGYAWSRVRFEGKPRSHLFGAWLLAVAAHGVFDFVALGYGKGALIGLGVLLVLVDASLTARIARALRDSPFRPPGADEEDYADLPTEEED